MLFLKQKHWEKVRTVFFRLLLNFVGFFFFIFSFKLCIFYLGAVDKFSNPCVSFYLGILDILSGDMPKGNKIQRKHLEALIELHNVTQTFARNIQHAFSDSDLRVLMDTLKAVYFPFESFKQR